MAARVPAIRIRNVNQSPVQPAGDYVLYWMIASRRTTHSFALDRAIELCRELNRPLLVLEALRSGYRWANDRLHAFVLQGMADNRAAFARRGVRHHVYVETGRDEGRGLLETLAERACTVVTDDWPCFFVPRMVTAAGKRLGVRLEAIDSNGLLPIRAPDKVFARAFDFRRYLHRVLPDHLEHRPAADPLAKLRGMPSAHIPETVTRRWPAADDALLRGRALDLAEFPIDHDVGPSPVLHGGPRAGSGALRTFLRERLSRYADERNHPDSDAQSGLSAYLHFGHVGTHQVLAELASAEGFEQRGSLTGDALWDGSASANGFLDQLVTWRELGFNFCSQRPDDYASFESLPNWARRTMAEHSADRRPRLHTIDELADAATDDEIWNAAQRELQKEGRIHNYLRMLWGKKVLEWTPSPEIAAEVLIELNNRYALDGRDPNSYSGIFWVFGRFDRAWGPERPIFGKLRYMTSDSARRKLHLKGYLAQHS